MSTVVFVLNTSPSMFQRSYGGIQYLDYAKSTIETFFKVREYLSYQTRDQSRYLNTEFVLLLMNFDGICVQSTRNMGSSAFLSYVRELGAGPVFNITSSLEHAFKYLNEAKLNVPNYDFDNFGKGWIPWGNPCESVILLTSLEYNVVPLGANGGKRAATLSREEMTSYELVASHMPYVGSDLYTDVHRWYQKIFVFLFEKDYNPSSKNLKTDVEMSSDIRRMKQMLHRIATRTGGLMFIISGLDGIMKATERFYQVLEKCSVAIVINRIDEECITTMETPVKKEKHQVLLWPAAAKACSNEGKEAAEKRQGGLTVARPQAPFVGRWLMPDDFIFEDDSSYLPHRDSNPVVYITREVVKLDIPGEFLTDKYAIGSDSLGNLAELSEEAGTYYMIYKKLRNDVLGGKIVISKPFGLLTRSGGERVLYLLPYDFESLFKLRKSISQQNLKKKLPNVRDYILSAPCMYMSNLNSITKLSPLFPSQFLYGIVKEHAQYAKMSQRLREMVRTFSYGNSGSNTIMYGNGAAKNRKSVDPFSFSLSLSRESMLEEVMEMSRDLYGTTFDAKIDNDMDHSLPVSQMGNYARQPQQGLREVYNAPTFTRSHSFGNPFKMKVKVDEMEEFGDVANARGARSAPSQGPAGKKKITFRMAMEQIKRSKKGRYHFIRTPKFREIKRSIEFLVRDREGGVRKSVEAAREKAASATSKKELSHEEQRELNAFFASVLKRYNIKRR